MSRPFIKRAAFATRLSFRVAVWVSKVLLRLLPPSLEVFLHREFGIRYFGRIVGSLLILLIYREGVLLIPRVRSDPCEKAFLELYSLCFVFLAGFHFLAACTRHYRDQNEPHSHGAGSPLALWSQLPFPPAFVQRFAEPILCFCLALLVCRWSSAVAVWLKASSIALFVKVQIQWWLTRHRTLDALDAQVEARHLNARVQASLAPRAGSTGQFYVASAPGQPNPPPPDGQT